MTTDPPDRTAPEIPWKTIVDVGPVAVLLCDRRGIICYANPRVAEMFGYAAQELVGAGVEVIVPEASRSAHVRAREEYVRAPRTYLMGEGRDLTGLKKDGSQFPVEIALSVVPGGSGLVIVVASIADVTARKDGEDRLRTLAEELRVANVQLEELATSDPLTKLLNRRGMEQRLQEALHMARRSGACLSAVFIDCDDFKLLNDRHGHTVGDRTLQALGSVMQASVRPGDHCARVGGDEFMILLPGTCADAAGHAAERVSGALRATLSALAPSVHVTLSAGVAELPATTTSLEDAIRLTQNALKEAKARGKGRISTSSPPRTSGP